MIAALSEAGLILDEPRYPEAARQAAAFIRDKLRDAGGNAMLDLALKEGVEVTERNFKDKKTVTRSDAAELLSGLAEKR